ncbi:MAG: 50S ribosomal protein L24 [Candidatus Eremiobacteraeota bacterium]|nr:50S ribosomal protein L24 [Candidatus Eremiobacteraeota bacterium]
MKKAHIKKNDTVLVLSGKDKGKRAKAIELNHRKGTILVEGVNVMKKHTKPRPPKIPQGGILEKAMPIAMSKVMLVCPQCSVPIRAKMVIGNNGKERVCRKCNEVI